MFPLGRCTTTISRSSSTPPWKHAIHGVFCRVVPLPSNTHLILFADSSQRSVSSPVQPPYKQGTPATYSAKSRPAGSSGSPVHFILTQAAASMVLLLFFLYTKSVLHLFASPKKPAAISIPHLTKFCLSTALKRFFSEKAPTKAKQKKHDS